MTDVVAESMGGAKRTAGGLYSWFIFMFSDKKLINVAQMKQEEEIGTAAAQRSSEQNNTLSTVQLVVISN